jgi:hypothetical protein
VPGRLLIFNLLVVAVTLMVSGVAVLGFRHASQIQEQVQQQTLDDMTGSMNLARDTANVARRRCGSLRWWGRWNTKVKPTG